MILRFALHCCDHVVMCSYYNQSELDACLVALAPAILGITHSQLNIHSLPLSRSRNSLYISAANNAETIRDTIDKLHATVRNQIPKRQQAGLWHLHYPALIALSSCTSTHAGHCWNPLFPILLALLALSLIFSFESSVSVHFPSITQSQVSHHTHSLTT